MGLVYPSRISNIRYGVPSSNTQLLRVLYVEAVCFSKKKGGQKCDTRLFNNREDNGDYRCLLFSANTHDKFTHCERHNYFLISAFKQKRNLKLALHTALNLT